MAFTLVSLPAASRNSVNNMSEKYEYEAPVVIPAYNAAPFITTQLEALAK